MKRKLLASCILLLSIQALQAQFCPPNLDFETGTLANWQCSIGTVVNQRGVNTFLLTNSAPTTNRHELVTAPATGPRPNDLYGGFPQLCPYGGNYSVKLGNNSSGGEAEGISYTFVVPPLVDTFSFTYFYAVVFENPGHDLADQPRFFVSAYNVADGSVINCASYDYVSTGSIPGFQISAVDPGVLYKNWTPSSIQFVGLANQTIRLEFKTGDCTIGGHFGYAYLDVGSNCTNILATAPYCAETNSLLLNAPYGFQTYTWYNSDYSAVVGNQQSITLSPPPVTSGTFHVDMIPYPGYGCRDTLDAIVQPLPVPDTPIAPSFISLCQYTTPNQLSAIASPNCELLWYTAAAGGLSNNIPPTPSTNVAGTYNFYVSQKVLFGCESLRKKITVKINPTPRVSIGVNQSRQCQNGNQFIFTSNSIDTSNASYTWNLGVGPLITGTATSITHTYDTAGFFQVSLTVQNPPSCSATANIPITIVPKPLADFTFPPILCEKQTPLVLSDNSSVPNGLSSIAGWWWNIGGSTSTSSSPTPIIPNNPGNLVVKLVSRTAEGCRSDTSTKTLPIHFRPQAAFTHNQPLCNNEVVRFNDASSLPAGSSPEKIIVWNWLVDGIQVGAQQNHAQIVSAGVHQFSQQVESDFGCRSLRRDSIVTVYPKPAIRLEITDSCVFRTIHYHAIDVSQTVQKWYWNFGNGFGEGNPSILKVFETPGYRPLTVFGKTIHGCSDTVVRPFSIYNNTAHAPHDTIAAINQPVLLLSGGNSTTTYHWSPSEGLNNPTAINPVATLDKDILYKLDAVTIEGCDTHTEVLVKRFSGPELYIPTAFTPNRDRLNELLKVFPVGIQQFGYLAIYNRNGNLLYYTTDFSKGWDGTYKGQSQDPGNYVAVSEAIDFTGKKMMKRVNVVLIR